MNKGWGGFAEVEEVGIAVLLPPVLSHLVEERGRYGGRKLEVSLGHSSVDRLVRDRREEV